MKEPQDWKSGDDPATPSQESYLETLAQQTGESVPHGLTNAAASEKIDELRAKVGLDDQGETANQPDDGDTPVYGLPIVPGNDR
jgi:hypothetical protein